MPRRWFGDSMNPPVPIALPVVKVRRPASTALLAAFISWFSGTFSEASRDGSACTSISLRFSPQIATFATPGTCSSRALIVYCATVERSSGESVLEEMPTCMTRLVAETIGYSAGGAAQEGRAGAAADSRSWTSWRAWSTSVAPLK